MILFFDQVWRRLEYRKQQASGKKILIITQSNLESYEVLETIKHNFSLPTEFISPEDIDNTQLSNYEMCVVIGMFDKLVLQTIFEKTRMNDTRFFHISE